MSSELERFRDHARAMADYVPGKASEACAGNHNPWTVTTWREPDHDACKGGGCRCVCHTPTDADRELWERLAVETDDHLARHQDTPLEGSA